MDYDKEEFKKSIRIAYLLNREIRYFITPALLAIYSFIYALQFIFRTRESYRTSNLYIAISNFIELPIFGGFLLVSSAIILISLILPRLYGRPLLIMGCTINFSLFFFYSLISLQNANMHSTSIIHMTFSFFNLLLAVNEFIEMKLEIFYKNGK